MAIAKPLRLTVSLAARKLIAYRGTPLVIGDQFQSDQLPLEIQVVDETGNLTTPVNVLNLAGLGLRVSVGQQPTGASGGPSPIALQTDFTWDAARSLFVGTLALNTAEVNTYIGTAAERQAWFEIKLSDGADRLTLLQILFLLKAVVDEATDTVPVPTDQFLTANESDARYARKAGETAYLLTNATTGKTMMLYLGDDDALHSELLT